MVPAAVTAKLAVAPAYTVWLAGWAVIEGATTATASMGRPPRQRINAAHLSTEAQEKWGRGPRGPTVLLLLTIVALVLPSAALVGYVPRYRYPADPLLAVLAAGGLVAAIALVRAGWSRRAALSRRQ